jgi:hypothetical protein
VAERSGDIAFGGGESSDEAQHMMSDGISQHLLNLAILADRTRQKAVSPSACGRTLPPHSKWRSELGSKF